jgi:hypothetical protein
MSDYATEAARNLSLKESHPSIDDPIAAINFAVSLPSDECQPFLNAWVCGAWAEIEDCYRQFLERLLETHRHESVRHLTKEQAEDLTRRAT